MNTFNVICVNDHLIAKSNVPEIIEIGTEFFTNKKYKITRITNSQVTLLNEYNLESNFMLDHAYKNINYLWDWFKQ